MNAEKKVWGQVWGQVIYFPPPCFPRGLFTWHLLLPGTILQVLMIFSCPPTLAGVYIPGEGNGFPEGREQKIRQES